MRRDGPPTPGPTIVAHHLALFYAMDEALWFPVALMLEIGGIFAIWNWSRRQRSLWWLLFGLALVLIVIGWIAVSASDLPQQAYAGFFGMYLFAALAWAWWAEGLSPPDWKAGEIAVAIFAVALVSIAIAGTTPAAREPMVQDSLAMTPRE